MFLHLPPAYERLHHQLLLPLRLGVGPAPHLPGPRLPRRHPLGGLPPLPLRAGQLSEPHQTVSGPRPHLGPRVVGQPSPRRLWSHLRSSRHSGDGPRILQGKF